MADSRRKNNPPDDLAALLKFFKDARRFIQRTSDDREWRNFSGHH